MLKRSGAESSKSTIKMKGSITEGDDPGIPSNSSIISAGASVDSRTPNDEVSVIR